MERQRSGHHMERRDRDIAWSEKTGDIPMSNASPSWQTDVESIHSGYRIVRTQITKMVGARFLGREVAMVKYVGLKMGWGNCGVGRHCTRVLERKKKLKTLIEREKLRRTFT